MRGKSIWRFLLPVLLAAELGACASNGVRPGIVSTSGSSVASAPPYGNSQAYGNQAYGNQNYGNQGYGNAPSYAAAQPGETGRVVSINDVSLRGGGGGGSGNGTMIGGLLGGLGGIAIGASGGRGVGGGLIGGVLGAVGGAIAGNIIGNHTNIGGGGRGIEVTVQKDDGQTVTVAQRDDGDVQLGDRVQVVQDRGGVAKVVRDNSRQPDYQSAPAPQDYRQPAGSYDPPPQDYRTTRTTYDPPPQDYRQTQYAPPVSSTRTPTPYQRSSSQDYRQGNPQPADDPRYGNLD
jgi:outer membrane lipoprotein SlyB